jgi:UPF0755 protein
MIKKKLNLKKLFLYIILPITIIIFFIVGMFFYSLTSVSKKDKEIVFEVKSGETYSTIASKLKNNDLIRSEFSFKMFIKIKNINHLEIGYYKLNTNMSVNDIIEYFEKGSTFNPNLITITIPEGKTIIEIAKIIAKTTGKDYKEYLNYWDSDEFVNKAMDKYDFIKNDVKNSNIRYALEGYFFPSTYELQNKDVSAEYIAYKLLDQMEVVLNKYKSQIDSSTLNIHQILTLASIVEYEAKLDVDRPIIAGVFYNRLKANMKLQSCATVGYAIDEWKLSYTTSDLKVNSPYNTYYYTGLPVGPGNSPSEESIKATLNPTASDYYFFIADVCHDGIGEDDKVYYSKNNVEHNAYIRKYLGCL